MNRSNIPTRDTLKVGDTVRRWNSAARRWEYGDVTSITNSIWFPVWVLLVDYGQQVAFDYRDLRFADRGYGPRHKDWLRPETYKFRRFTSPKHRRV